MARTWCARRAGGCPTRGRGRGWRRRCRGVCAAAALPLLFFPLTSLSRLFPLTFGHHITSSYGADVDKQGRGKRGSREACGGPAGPRATSRLGNPAPPSSYPSPPCAHLPVPGRSSRSFRASLSESWSERAPPGARKDARAQRVS